MTDAEEKKKTILKEYGGKCEEIPQQCLLVLGIVREEKKPAKTKDQKLRKKQRGDK